MSWVAVRSSQVHSISYDASEELLRVRFGCFKCKTTGLAGTESCPICAGKGHSSEYHYAGVPVSVYQALREADADPQRSVGSELNRLIKKGEHSNPPRPFEFKRVL